MGSKWREAKWALGLNKCLVVPETLDDDSSSSSSFSSWISGDSKRSFGAVSYFSSLNSFLRAPSKRTCAICLADMKRGGGQAVFTAECSHSFHFHCITSSVNHGNRTCPICRSQWKEVPLGNGVSVPSPHTGVSVPTPPWLPPAPPLVPHPVQSVELPVFDDDEMLPEVSTENRSDNNGNAAEILELKTFPETSAVAKRVSRSDFAVLIHIKAPEANTQRARAPLDLIAVLDVSGSMNGTKIDLLKRAMRFVIQNLGSSDRLSIVAFCSTARRLFPLRLMSEMGKLESLVALESLFVGEGTNIARGLKVGAKVILDRKWKNPVSGIILLSDGQDTYTFIPPDALYLRSNYESLIPVSIRRNNNDSSFSSSIPVHAFGFGLDHDAALMHAIAQISRGTFSFIEDANVIQDAFAQCIGGLMSVVAQDLRVEAKRVDPCLKISSIKTGSYQNGVSPDGGAGWIDVGDLYAEEERDFLVILEIPSDKPPDENSMSLLSIKCIYKEPLTRATIALDEPDEVKILRPLVITGQPKVSIEVDRQRNRFLVAQVMSEARVLAERGDLAGAVSVLETCKTELSESVSARSGDSLSDALLAGLLATQERMANLQVYWNSGRAYVLSSMSSHSSQRATTRGDSTEIGSRIRAYQTTSMTGMVNRSRTLGFVRPYACPNPNPNRCSCPTLNSHLT